MVLNKGAKIRIFFKRRSLVWIIFQLFWFILCIFVARQKQQNMGFFLKLILTGLGWSFGGPLGGIIGYAIGSLFSGNRPKVIRSEVTDTFGNTEEKRDFNVTLLVLSAAVMKADGNVRKSELDYVKRFFLQNFGQTRAENYIKMLREILGKEYNLYEVSQQVGRYMDYASRLQLLHYLFGIANADGRVSQEELGVINTISDYMGITNSDFQSVKAMFIKETDSAYKILGIEPSATDDEVKKAYREMAKKNHPDLVSNLGDEVRQAAEKKFQEINAAYESIKKQRGL
jgi:DnaJ like chaperone protein